MDINGSLNYCENNCRINDFSGIVACTSTSDYVDSTVLAENRIYADHRGHCLQLKNIWTDYQRIQMQEQVNTWNKMMYRYWKLQKQQHLIPRYRHAWRTSYEVMTSETQQPSHTLAPTIKTTKKSSNTKKPKIVFTEKQLSVLEKSFQETSYLGNLQRQRLANKLGITERQVTQWYRNQRLKTVLIPPINNWIMNIRSTIAMKMKQMP
ncbi:homeobox protein Dlx6a-like [Melanaphis sacchari]|uniref:homeobox protein Dlx6a-like n=1 Tax=Melanaphis sacchari TaxID=742174 RepID=UPI000DC159E9|nr:homeobox protein Dlx6a-like [Melanaphis sacchari]